MSKPAGFDPFYKSSAGLQWYRRVNRDGTTDFAMADDAQAVLDQNKRDFTQNDGWTQNKKWGRRRARIPLSLWLKWLNEEGVNVFDPSGAEFLKKKLRDPDYCYLLTADYYH